MSKDKRCQEEIMSDRAVDLLASHKQQAEKIKELERIIVEAKECVKITQESNDNLQNNLRAHKASVDFLIQERNFFSQESERLRAKLDALQLNRDFLFTENERFRDDLSRKNCRVDELLDECSRLNKQIEILKDMIIQRQMHNLCYCDKCCKARGDTKQYKEKLLKELDDLLFVKEGQEPPTGIERIIVKGD